MIYGKSYVASTHWYPGFMLRTKIFFFPYFQFKDLLKRISNNLLVIIL